MSIATATWTCLWVSTPTITFRASGWIVRSHAPKIHWAVSEQDALDILTTLSLVHPRLDAAIQTHVR